ncbi:DUF3889 domain-containing protein [Virgibacillus siamensis]|uniref:DUF3889 domain-containing protein n=1 Tax=Virgibacillus siamensis TaxID=480071 RepID=UPI001FE8B1F6|nr:DUF3889 domain-containing protein [Virgibacillus siamensis]
MNWYANGPQYRMPFHGYPQPYPINPYRQQTIRGQATWTEGGPVSKCGIPWSANEYMTVAVSPESPYQCGQTLKITNPAIPQREVIVTVVDVVPGAPPNRINLQKRAFTALGANPAQGVISVEITPSPELEGQEWGKYLLEVVQIGYPNYDILEYDKTGETHLAGNKVKETYEYVLESPQERLKVRGTVIYNAVTERIISFDVQEINE